MGRSTAHSIERRLRSDSGATLVLAMLVLLAASMFSMAILSGSVNAAQTARGQYETEQSYLVVSAAARLVNQAILYPNETPDAEKVYKREVVLLRDDEDMDGRWPENEKLKRFLKEENGFEEAAGYVKENPLYRPEQAFPLSVRELLSHMYKQCETAPEEGQRNPFHSLTITLPLEGQKTRTVAVELAMRRPSDGVENPYGLTAALTIVGATDESGAADRFNPYSMTLEYTCTAIPDPVEKREPNFHIEENKEDGSKAKVLDNIETVTITTTTLTWELTKVGRGEIT